MWNINISRLVTCLIMIVLRLESFSVTSLYQCRVALWDRFYSWAARLVSSRTLAYQAYPWTRHIWLRIQGWKSEVLVSWESSAYHSESWCMAILFIQRICGLVAYLERDFGQTLATVRWRQWMFDRLPCVSWPFLLWQHLMPRHCCWYSMPRDFLSPIPTVLVGLTAQLP